MQPRRPCIAVSRGLRSRSPRKAQQQDALKKGMIGQWELSTTERSKTCVVTMKNEAAQGGLKLELSRVVAAALPFTQDIAGASRAWTSCGCRMPLARP
jgi:hypothetical protein